MMDTTVMVKLAKLIRAILALIVICEHQLDLSVEADENDLHIIPLDELPPLRILPRY